MRCVLLPLIDENDWEALSQEERASEMAAFRAYGGALREAGALVGNYRPDVSAKAKTVRVQEDAVHVNDGPHIAAKEQLAGIYIIEVPDLDAAIEWAARAPASRYGVVEVRPIWDPRS